MCFIEIHFNLAEYYADIDVKASRSKTKALVNKWNWFLISIYFTRNKEIYLEAIGIQADCVQEIYNLGLAYVRLDIPEEAGQAFDKLLTVLTNTLFLSTR